MERIRWVAVSVLVASSGGCALSGESVEESSAALGTGIVVNECTTGTSGSIELYNSSTAAIDLGQDPSFCWFVDDIEGGGKPKRIADGVVNHAAASTTCADAGRAAGCSLVAAGERVWISYAYVNSASADQCRLVKSALTAGTCETVYVDQFVGGNTSSTSSGQCFGRIADGAAWSDTAISCSPNGATNGCALAGQACDDGNPCTSGETYDASCACGGGTGSCPAPAQITINEFSAGNAGWVELHNAGALEADVSGWQIDDVANGGTAPKTIAQGSKVPAGGFAVVTYSGFNTASADEVRLIDGAGAVVDSHSNFYAQSSIANLCFGRQPNGGTWSASSLACTKGTSNGIVCTPTTCDDGNACTTDSCDPFAGCSATPVADGQSCGTDLVCQAGQCVATNPGGAELTSVGVSGSVLLRGTIITPDDVIVGEVLVEGDTITCVGVSCAGASQTGAPSVIETHGIIAPGMIDAHNHILFDIFDEDDWSPTKAYANHNQWPNDAKYGAMVDAKQYLNGEYGSSVNVGCEMNKYGELKGLVSGTTSIVGAANPANKVCYGSLARTIDQTSNDLGSDKIQAATLFPTAAAADGICANIATDKTDSFVVHVGEGIDQTSRNEFAQLYSVPTTDGCLHTHETAIVHGTAFGATEFSQMGALGMSLVWSPRSNVFLYGMGTDLTKTTNIPMALSYGINVALAPDWSIGGSQNLLDELRFANQVDDGAFGNILTPKALLAMVTIQAAKALAIDNVLGSIEVGKKADLFVIGGNVTTPYDAVLAAQPSDVRLVMVNGVALYGDPALLPVAPAAPGCETLDVCTIQKFVCVAEAGGTASNKLGQTLADIRQVLTNELASYDAMDVSSWDFSPIAPLVKCH